ncbi:hypothetical protein TWF481_003189 [Arthrobotrys musiformis]|uniref:BTB domain-containing protein n=1 Tax=Arthrobotrys musiformis TaxID=47236 RepID=A0AAV9VRH7_9PEZI
MGSTQNENSFKDLFNKQDFADVLAVVRNPHNGSHTQYYMHQIIVCNSCDHFKALCASAPTDGAYKVLSFSTTPRAFELIAQWVYRNKKLETDDMDAVTEALEYADGADMEDLRVGLLKRFLQVKLEAILQADSDSHWQIFGEVCQYALPRDRDFLVNCVKFLRRNNVRIVAPESWLQDLSECSRLDAGLVAAVLIEDHQKPSIFYGADAPDIYDGFFKDLIEDLLKSYQTMLKPGQLH